MTRHVQATLVTNIEELLDSASVCDGTLRNLLAAVAYGVKFRLTHRTLAERQRVRRNQEYRLYDEPAGLVEFMEWEIPYWGSSAMAYGPTCYENVLGQMSDDDYMRDWRLWKRLPRNVRIAIWDRFLGKGEGVKRERLQGQCREASPQETAYIARVTRAMDGL